MLETQADRENREKLYFIYALQTTTIETHTNPQYIYIHNVPYVRNQN